MFTMNTIKSSTKEPSDIIKDSMTTQEKIDKIVEAIQEGDSGV